VIRAGTAAQVATAQDAPVDVVERLGERVASAPFMDSESHRVQLRDLVARDKPVVLTLIYFDCPMLCSLVQKGVIKALNETGLRLGRITTDSPSASRRRTPFRGAAAAGRLSTDAPERRQGASGALALPGRRDTSIRTLADSSGSATDWTRRPDSTSTRR